MMFLNQAIFPDFLCSYDTEDWFKIWLSIFGGISDRIPYAENSID